MDYGTFAVNIQLDALKTVEIDNKDIYKVFFNEDIYSFGSVGKIILHDKYGLKEYGPVTGDEKLIVTYGKEAPIAKEFSLLRISKISGVKEFQQTRTSVLELHFSDTFFGNLVRKRFCKAWGVSKKASDIVEDILVNLVGIEKDKLNIEASESTLDYFHMPYWTPADAIRWLANRIKGTKGKCNYGYLLFPNSKKYLNFMTLDSLLNNAEIDSDTYLFETTNLYYDNKILSWQQTGVDHMSIRELGGGQLLGYDYNTKSIIGIEKDESFIYSKAIENITTLGASSLFDGFTIDNDSDTFNYTYETTGENDKTILKNLFYNNFIRRYSLQNMVQFLMAGYNRRYAGQKINVQWPSATANDIFSSMDSGQYLIKSIMHSFNPMQTPYYLQTLTCIKNAYENNKYNTTTASINNAINSIFKMGIFG